MANKLSHVNSRGEARMVDISLKGVTVREAVPEAPSSCSPLLWNR